MRLLSFAALVLLAACADRGLTDLEIVHRYCLLKGDTVGVLKSIDNDGIVSRCDWLLAQTTICDTLPIGRAPVTCVVGQKAA